MRRSVPFLFTTLAVLLSIGLLVAFQRSELIRSKFAELDLPRADHGGP